MTMCHEIRNMKTLGKTASDVQFELIKIAKAAEECAGQTYKTASEINASLTKIAAKWEPKSNVYTGGKKWNMAAIKGKGASKKVVDHYNKQNRASEIQKSYGKNLDDSRKGMARRSIAGGVAGLAGMAASALKKSKGGALASAAALAYGAKRGYDHYKSRDLKGRNIREISGSKGTMTYNKGSEKNKNFKGAVSSALRIKMNRMYRKGDKAGMAALRKAQGVEKKASENYNKDQIFEIVSNIIGKSLNLPQPAIRMESSVRADLGADNLDAIEITMSIEEAFNIDLIYDRSRFRTVGDIVNHLVAHSNRPQGSFGMM